MGISSEIVLSGVPFNALRLSRITYPIKIKRAFLVFLLSKEPMLIKVPKYI